MNNKGGTEKAGGYCVLREGVTNKGGGLSRCAKGSQTRAGGYRAEERNR